MSFIDKILLGDTERLTRNPQREGIDHLIIHPGNRLKAIFDALIQCITLYSMAVAPLEFGFGYRPAEGFDVMVDIFFCFDVVRACMIMSPFCTHTTAEIMRRATPPMQTGAELYPRVRRAWLPGALSPRGFHEVPENLVYTRSGCHTTLRSHHR
jgi:hypothetical protein